MLKMCDFILKTMNYEEKIPKKVLYCPRIDSQNCGYQDAHNEVNLYFGLAHNPSPYIGYKVLIQTIRFVLLKLWKWAFEKIIL